MENKQREGGGAGAEEGWRREVKKRRWFFKRLGRGLQEGMACACVCDCVCVRQTCVCCVCLSVHMCFPTFFFYSSPAPLSCPPPIFSSLLLSLLSYISFLLCSSSLLPCPLHLLSSHFLSLLSLLVLACICWQYSTLCVVSLCVFQSLSCVNTRVRIQSWQCSETLIMYEHCNVITMPTFLETLQVLIQWSECFRM